MFCFFFSNAHCNRSHAYTLNISLAFVNNAQAFNKLHKSHQHRNIARTARFAFTHSIIDQTKCHYDNRHFRKSENTISETMEDLCISLDFKTIWSVQRWLFSWIRFTNNSVLVSWFTLFFCLVRCVALFDWTFSTEVLNNAFLCVCLKCSYYH